MHFFIKMNTMTVYKIISWCSKIHFCIHISELNFSLSVLKPNILCKQINVLFTYQIFFLTIYFNLYCARVYFKCTYINVLGPITYLKLYSFILFNKRTILTITNLFILVLVYLLIAIMWNRTFHIYISCKYTSSENVNLEELE